MEAATRTGIEYTGPSTLAGNLLRHYWQPVYVSDDLASGRTMPIRILSEDFTLYRGDDGAAHIVAARCAHRSVLLSVGIVEGSCVRCRYHGWKYDENGQCVEQPFEHEGFAAKVSIKSYPVEEYFGLIWLYLGDDTPPPLPRWPELEHFGRFHVVELRKWNYYQDLENSVDDVHQLWVHKDGIYQDAGKTGQIPEMSACETDFGVTQTARFPSGYVRNLALMMPNTLYFTSGAGMLRGFRSFLWNVPVDDESHIMFFLFIAGHLSPEDGENVARVVKGAREYLAELASLEDVTHDVLSGRARWEDIEERLDLALLEDDIVLRSQGVIVDRSAERLGSSDAAIILLRKLYAREMAAIQAGRPLTRFKTPDVETLTALADG